MTTITSRRLYKAYCGLIALSFALCSQTVSAEDYTVGADAGSFSVSNSGSGSWSLPIEVPPGIRGLEPNLTVSVSTSRANGLLGQGGGLSGTSAITRCGKTIVQDGYNSGISLNTNDAYCLDGNRLVLVSGTYGASGSEYRTELESFQRIIANGAAGSAGPQSFTVTSRSGTQMSFGGNASSRDTHSSGAVLAWRISRVTDLSSNRMDYTYSSNPPEASVLTEVNYGANDNAGQAHFLKAVIEYENRPDTSTAYRFGNVVSSAKRIKAIKTYAEGNLIRDYRFSYEIGESSQISRLKKAKECAGSGACLAPTTFSYTAEATSWQTAGLSIPEPLQNSNGTPRGVQADLNNDGWNDWIVSVRNNDGSTSNDVWLGGSSGYSPAANWDLPAVLFNYQLHADGVAPAQLTDVNGDGYIDIVSAWNGTSGLQNQVWLNTGTGWQASSLSLPSVLVDIQADGSVINRANLADINGDGRTDVLVSLKDQSGAVVRQAWINNGNGWAQDSNYAPPSVASDYLANSEGQGLATLADINGDGLADWVQTARTTSGLNTQVWRNTGTGWSSWSAYNLPAELVDYSTDSQGLSKGDLADINGDGLADLVHAYKDSGGVFHRNTWLNTGAGWSAQSSWNLPAALIQQRSDHYTDGLGALLDLDGDGQSELVQSYRAANGSITFNAWTRSANSWISYSGEALPLPLFQHHSNQGSTGYAQMGDLDGDGHAEYFTTFSGQNNTVYQRGYLDGGNVPGTLTQVTNGLGLETHIQYGVSTDASLYTLAPISAWPNVADNSNRLLIKQVASSNGLGGWNGATHHYSASRFNTIGRGGLGFESHSASDNRSGITIATEFYQTFPFTGMTKASSNVTQGGITLSDGHSVVAQLSLNNGKTVYPYAQSSESNDYDLNSGSWIQKKQITTDAIDDYGNTTQSTEMVTNVAGEAFTKIRSTTPELDLNNWILDKTGQTTETLQQPGKPDHTTTVNHAAYYANTNQLKTEVLEPGHAHSLTSTHEYDGFGNRIKTTIAPTNTQNPPLAPRVTQTNFSKASGRKDGRFPISVTNTLGHSASSTYHSGFGKPVLTTDANGVRKKYIYDAFGTQLNEYLLKEGTLEPRSKEVAIPHWCEASHNCPDYAKYFVAALDTEGEATEYAYYDIYGREIRRKTQGFGGKWIYQDTEYDEYGRKYRISNHYFKDNPAEAKWKTTEYDILDRPIQITMPDGGVTTIAYNGLSTVSTNPLGQDSTVEKNILGKARISTDADGNSTEFTYDVRGNLLTTTDSAGNQIVNVYDQFGRKQSMDDPDMGYWTYEYDAFGQMVSQTDANGETVTMEYDALGRMLSRNEREGQTTWSYDTQTHGIGKLTRISSPNYVREPSYDDLGRPETITVSTNNQSYTTEFGYTGATEKIDWVKYPTGLVVHKHYDDYGFPNELQSINLEKYLLYKNELDKANTHYRQAQILQERYQDEYDELKAIVDPYYERLEAARNAAQPWLNLVDKANAKEVQHNQLAGKYYDEYMLSYTPYDNHIKKAEGHLATSNSYQRKGDDAWTIAVGHLHSGNSYESQALSKYRVYKDYNQRGCANLPNSQWTGKVGELCRDVGTGGYGRSNDPNTAVYWFERASPYGTEYERLINLANSKFAIYNSQASIAQGHWNTSGSYQSKANTEYGKAASYEEKVSLYGATLQSHQNIQLGFQARRESYENKAVPHFGRWEKRSDAGNTCLDWAGDDAESDYCVTQKGMYQTEYDALAATGKEARYKEIIEEIEAEVKLGDEAKKLADGYKTDYLGSKTTYWTALDADADGQIKKARYGNDVDSTWAYDAMGRVGSINTTTPHTDTIQTSNQIQNDIFDFDLLGNLRYRHDFVDDFREDFEYDTLNRLTKAEVSGQGASLYALVGLTTINLSYDALGNITSKSDVTGASGSYSYGSGIANGAGPHAVTAISGKKNTSFSYDNNGNQLSGNGRTIAYTSFNKPNQVSKGASATSMAYGPERQLLQQIETINGQTSTTTYLTGLYEEVETQGNTKARHHLTIAGQSVAVIHFEKDTSTATPSYQFDDTHYLHRDHLNSITAITDKDGKLVERHHYDAFGQRRTAVQAPFQNIAAAGFFPVTNRGYTGHKQMGGVDLIHMGGRVYDPEIGRFLSADPHIQAPLNTQSLNRYSYVNNNPLSYTDPSGYFFKKLFKAFKKLFKKIARVIQKVVKAIVKVVKAVVKVVKKAIKVIKKYIKPLLAVAVAVIAPYAVAAIASGAGILATGTVALSTMSAGMTIAAGAIGGGLAGLVSTGSLKGMLIGAISGAAFAGIGNYYGGVKAANAGIKGLNTLKNGLTAAQQVGKVIMHGVAGGIRSVLSGGKFKDGFVSAGFAQLAAPVIDNIPSDTGQVVAAGVAGGVGAELVGGDFEQGFVTGVFSRAFNDNLDRSRNGVNDSDLPNKYTPDGLANRNVNMRDFRPGGSEDVRSNMLDRSSDGMYGPNDNLSRQDLTNVGNYNYGYAGAKNGYDLDTLQDIGDYDQYLSGKQGCYVCVPKDNSLDANMIKNGYEDYNSRVGW